MADSEPIDRRAGRGRRDEDRSVAEHFDEFDREGLEITKGGILDALAVTKESVEVLADSIDKLASKEELEVVRVETSNKTRRLSLVVVVVAVALVAGLALFLELRAIAAENRENGRILVECTTPTEDPTDPHECYDQAQLSRGTLTGDLSDLRLRLTRIEELLQEDR